MTALKLRAPVDGSSMAMDVGDVVRVDSACYVVRTRADGLRECRLAASCLLVPEAGDQVLLSQAGAHGCYVIAVLERRAGSTQQLNLTGDTRLSVKQGVLMVEGECGLSLASDSAVTLKGRELSACAESGTFVVGTTQWVGRVFNGTVGRLKLVGEALELLVDRVVQHSRVSLRRIDDVERVESRQIDYQARELLCLRGDATLIGGKELIKADGKQIHLG